LVVHTPPLDTATKLVDNVEDEPVDVTANPGLVATLVAAVVRLLT
jgi:hypothetical protein